jgi:hypothetical protein
MNCSPQCDTPLLLEAQPKQGKKMATVAHPSAPHATVTPLAEIDHAIADLRAGADRLAKSSLDERVRLVNECIANTAIAASEWVHLACAAKRIPIPGPTVAEEILGGPASLLRCLQLTARTLIALRNSDAPTLPGKPRVVHGQIRVPTFPTKSLYDSLVFIPMKAETWLQPEVSFDAIHGDVPAQLARRKAVKPKVTLVLGAGNVAAIPVTDALAMIFQNDSAALLKMNPVNDYLGPVFERALEPLIRARYLRIVYGDAKLGAYAVHHQQIDAVHITGSVETHDAIVWGSDQEQQRTRKQQHQPAVTKPVTSELGNVTPWVIVPGDYSNAQLRSQAETIAASITNNASFNCIATKVLITWKQWPQREHFLYLLDSILNSIQARYAYYPGAAERFSQFSGNPRGLDENGALPWTIRRDVTPQDHPLLFTKESFVCVTAETTLGANSPVDFLNRAVEFMNEQIWGTLAASVTVPDPFQKKHANLLDEALRRLNYGTIGINQWSGVAYGLISPPWGAYPGAELHEIQSGSGFVHNTYLLDRPQKTILRSPLTLLPKPVWFSTNRKSEQISWKLTELYGNPSLWRLIGLLIQAMQG